MKRMLRCPDRPRASRAAWMAARTSAVPALTAESCANRASVSAAITRASVVLPVPGGSPEEHREELPALDGRTEHAARAHDAVLADELGERAWPHARRERRLGRAPFVGSVEEVHGHGLVYPQHRPPGGPSTRMVSFGAMSKVLVLNTTYEPLNVCSARRALVLLLKEKAETLEHSGACYRSERHTYAVPHVIKLRHYVHVPRTARKRISRRAVFARDRYRCQYCGSDRPPHGRPRGPALQGRRRQLGERRHLVRAV